MQININNNSLDLNKTTEIHPSENKALEQKISPQYLSFLDYTKTKSPQGKFTFQQKLPLPYVVNTTTTQSKITQDKSFLTNNEDPLLMRNKQLNQQLLVYQADNQDMTFEIIELRKEIALLKDKNVQLMAQVETLRNQINDKSNALKEFFINQSPSQEFQENEIQNNSVQKVGLMKSNELLLNNINMLQKNLKTKEDYIQLLIKDYQSSKSKVQQLNTELEISKQRCQQILGDSQIKVSNLEKKWKEDTSKSLRLSQQQTDQIHKSELEQKDKKIASLEKLLFEIQDKNKDLRLQINNISNQLLQKNIQTTKQSDQVTQLIQMSQENTNLKNQVSDLNRRIQNQQKEIIEKDNRLANIKVQQKSKFKELKLQIDGFQNVRVDSHSSQQAKFDAQKLVYQNQISLLQNNIKDQDSKLIHYINQNQRLNDENIKLVKLKRVFKNQIYDIEKKSSAIISQLQKQVNSQKNKNLNIEETYKDIQIKFEQKQTENTSLKLTNQQLVEQKDDLQESLFKRKLQVENLLKQIDSITSEKQQLKEVLVLNTRTLQDIDQKYYNCQETLNKVTKVRDQYLQKDQKNTQHIEKINKDFLEKNQELTQVIQKYEQSLENIQHIEKTLIDKVQLDAQVIHMEKQQTLVKENGVQQQRLQLNNEIVK